MNRQFFRKQAALLLTIIMLISMLPTAALAGNGTSATVTFTAQADGSFFFAPQADAAVSNSLAESYGYSDSVSGGVSALDVLVNAHEVLYGEAGTAETAANYLTVDASGTVTTAFRRAGGDDFSFAVDNACPNDGVEADGAYTAYTVGQAQVVDGSLVEFFFYQDTTDYSDYYYLPRLPNCPDTVTREFTAVAGGYISLSVRY